MKNILVFSIVFLLGSLSRAFSQTLWLDEFDLSSMESGWGTPHAKKSVEGNPLSIHGQTFERGVGTHSVSTFLINLDGKGKRFTAFVGVDDEIKEDKASIDFYVLGDKKVLWKSGVMKRGEAPKKVDVDISGLKQLGLLAGDAGDGNGWDHADWADAKIELTESRVPAEMVSATIPDLYILTPKPSAEPKITGARIFGVRPGHPFLYTITASGAHPMTFEARDLPDGLTLDPASGQITGTVSKRGDYRVTLVAKNALGEVRRDLRISVGSRICLTPPMGWNSWNCWACAVDDEKVRASADAMVSSGLANHGWTYINIDDCWEVKPDAKDSILQGERRTTDGKINTNKKFPDMKALSDYVHSKGLKLGIYSGPGPLTCAGFTASYQFEQQDAMRYSDWGIDYLKYDWCSYDRIAKDKSLPELKKPYAVMRAALDKVSRDIVYSLCQYGMGEVWQWGAEVGGNCWRTTDDINDAWESMSGIGFGQAGHEKYAEPGHWNDPDMLVVGLVGWGPQLHPSHLTPDEQYTHITLWSLLSAPLLIGCDLVRLDEFTLNLLTNDEVIDVSQDPLGKQAKRVSAAGGSQIWVKEMEDGSKAVGMFFPDIAEKKSPVDYISWGPKAKAHVVLKASDIGIKGKFKVRDVWRQTDLGIFDKEFAADVPYHGVVLVRVTPEK